MTALNFRDGPDPKHQFAEKVPPLTIYGGVALNAVKASEGVADLFTDPEVLSFYGKKQGEIFLAAPWLLADFPLSAVADTLTLPITVPATIKRLTAAGVHAGLEIDTESDSNEAGGSSGDDLSRR
jgi:hypothetical protein